VQQYSNPNFSFPSIIIKESEKDEDWYKQYVQAIVNKSISDGYADRYAIANECVNFYQGLQEADEFEFLQKAEDGDTLPALWMNYNRIRTKVDLMIGELSQKKYEIFVRGINKELKSRKLQEKEKMLIDMRFQPIAQNFEEQGFPPLQAPPSPDGFQPQTEEELDDFFEREYKDMAEIIVTAILKYLAKVNNWDYQRIQMFYDILIMGMAFCRTEIIDGIPVSKRVDPRNMVWDVNATDDFLSDSTFFGEMQYMSIGDVVNQYNLTRKEIEESYSNYRDYMGGASQRYTTTANDFGLLNKNQGMKFFRQEGGELRVLVCKACWVDYKPFSNKESEDKFGNVHIKKVDPDSNEKGVKKHNIKVWRRGTLIAGKFLKEWGEIPNQARNWTSLSNADAPYKCLIPQYMNGIAVSKVHMMKNLQKMKNLALYRLQMDMARAGTKSFFYDINQLPEGMSFQNALKYMKTVGVIPIDSSANGNPTGFNQFKEVDQTISNNITAYLEISATMDREMDAISGINEARQGMVKNASQAVGVTQSSLFQSALATTVYYDYFSQFCSHVLDHQAKLAKIAWAGKERFSPIIGDAGINFLEVDIDMDLHDYAIFIEEVPPMIQDQQLYQQLIIGSVQAGQLPFVSAMKLLLEKDVRVGVRQLERETRKLMQQQQAQEQAAMQQQQQELAAQSEQAERDRQAKQLEGQIKNQEDMKKLIAQGRIGMRGQVLDFKKDLALKKLDNKLKERELNQKMAIDKQKGDIDIQKAQQQIKLQAQKAKAKPVAKKK
jgi:Membrane protein involved in colicin uptake